LPPNLFPYILPTDSDWQPRYAIYNQPGDYHNGGVWPFIGAFYIAALVAAGQFKLAEQKLVALTQLVRVGRHRKLAFGFNEWFSAQEGIPRGQDWQSWSASMYLYAVAAVEQRRTPFFDGSS
jgi:glycogen debranching enzyme